jgi:hypothetical protein
MVIAMVTMVLLKLHAVVIVYAVHVAETLQFPVTGLHKPFKSICKPIFEHNK